MLEKPKKNKGAWIGIVGDILIVLSVIFGVIAMFQKAYDIQILPITSKLLLVLMSILGSFGCFMLIKRLRQVRKFFKK